MSKFLNFIVIFTGVTFLLLEINGFNGIRKLEEQIEIRVFLNETATLELVEKVLADETGVKKLMFVSKEEALDEFKRNIKNSESFIGEIEENLLPSSFKLILKPGYKRPEYLQYLERKTLSLDGVNSFVYSREYLQNIWTIIKYFEWLSLGVSGLLFLLLVFTITTVSNQTLLYSKDEMALLHEFGVGKVRLLLKVSLKVFSENIGFVVISLFLSYCIYRFIWSATTPSLQAPVFFSIRAMLLFTGGFGVLTLFITFIFGAFRLKDTV